MKTSIQKRVGRGVPRTELWKVQWAESGMPKACVSGILWTMRNSEDLI